MEVDASETGVGAVFSQRFGERPQLHPVAFFSRKLSPTERNYDLGNRELLAVKLALEEWRHWLEGATHPFVIFTDHKNLDYLRTAKRLTPRQARWSLFFTRFHFTLSYRPRSKNTKADALSRLDHTEHVNDHEECIINALEWELDQKLEDIPQSQVPKTCPTGKLFVPEEYHQELVIWAHTVIGTGHPGVQHTYHLLREKYWWSNMERDIHRVVASCSTCAQSKVPRTLPAGKLKPLPVLECPWSHISVDFVTDLPRSQGNTTVLVTVDRFSKSVRFIPLPALPTAFTTAELLFQHVFRYSRGDCLRQGSSIHIQSMVQLYGEDGSYSESHLRLSPTSQWPS